MRKPTLNSGKEEKMRKLDIEKEFGVLGIGEVMLRLSPVGNERISHSETFEKNAGGSELNVVSGISMLGIRTGMITKLPKSEIGKFIKYKIRYSGTSDDYVIYDNSPNKRLGIYYYESGAYPRVSVVSYDRQNSSITTFRKEELPASVYGRASIFHTSGITMALDAGLRESVIEMMAEYRRLGALISFDVNYRAALWDEETARETVLRILPMVDVLFVSEETLRRMLGMTGTLEEIHKKLACDYPNLGVILSTRREVISPRIHNFSSLVYDTAEKKHYAALPYEHIEVIDRIGSGDAFVAGALYALLRFGNTEKMSEYGNAMSALKNTVVGDMAQCDITDIERIIDAHNSKGPKSEMVR